MYFVSRIAILGLSLLAVVIEAENPKDSTIVFSARATPEDIQLLNPIEPDEAIPLIFFDDGDKGLIPNLFPVDLAQVEIKEGRIWSSDNTRFLSIPTANPIFFCPNPDYSKKCILPVDFKQPQALQCSREPTYSLTEAYQKDGKLTCGPKEKTEDTENVHLGFMYETCPAPMSYKYRTTQLFTYTFCYNKSSKEPIYVAYKIVSPRLLSEKLLVKEREIKLSQDQISTETFDGKIDLYYKRYLESELRMRPLYKLQTLASPKHMAFYTWKKTTNHYINYDLQHGKLFSLWNEIQDYIAADATAMFAVQRTVVTGVIGIMHKDLPRLSDSYDQLFNAWVTVVAELSVEPFRGIAILMNNFIDSKKESDVVPYIHKLCDEKNLCDETLKMKFSNVQGEVRCCAVNKKIQSLFGISELESIEKVLPIRNIYSVDAVDELGGTEDESVGTEDESVDAV